jgi:hypothetical protein
MSLDKAIRNLKFDVRMTEFNMNHSFLSEDDQAKNLAQLEDCSGNSEPLKVDSSAVVEEEEIVTDESAQH